MWSFTEYSASFDALAGDIASLSTDPLKVIWWNEAQEKLNQTKARTYDITWDALDREIDLPADFVELDKIVFDQGSPVERWDVWDRYLVIYEAEGASGDGSARIYYWATFLPIEDDTAATELTAAQDYACLNYALHRFYSRLVSNRSYYKRYATMVGDNAVSQRDLQIESESYWSLFLDARADLQPDPPSFAYGR